MIAGVGRPGCSIDRAFWKGARVFITGHMGFKGAWLCALLARLGAETVGYGFDRRTRLLYRDLALGRHRHIEGDINDSASLMAALESEEPDVLLHLAAQPLVLASYDDPVGTFETNIMGTVRVLEAARNVRSLRAVVIVTSDKVYRNAEWSWGYRETDALGGADPYSSSKAAAEIVARSMAVSFFADEDAPRIATARAGNVIGGGDWADDRLIPDAARAFGQNQTLTVRNPASTRPWQHVLDPLAGYLTLAQHLADGEMRDFSSWNFGPAPDDALSVREVANLFTASWGGAARWTSADKAERPKEAGQLAVDSTLARRALGWHPRWNGVEAVRRTASWYRRAHDGAKPSSLVAAEIEDFLGADAELAALRSVKLMTAGEAG